MKKQIKKISPKKVQGNVQKSVQKIVKKEAPKPASSPVLSPADTLRPGIHPLGDRILVREIETEEKERMTASGIIIPVSENADKGSKRGEVIAVGPGKHEDGKVIPVNVSVGDKVLFQWGDKLVLDGDANEEAYYLVRESEVLAIIR